MPIEEENLKTNFELMGAQALGCSVFVDHQTAFLRSLAPVTLDKKIVCLAGGILSIALIERSFAKICKFGKF